MKKFGMHPERVTKIKSFFRQIKLGRYKLSIIKRWLEKILEK